MTDGYCWGGGRQTDRQTETEREFEVSRLLSVETSLIGIGEGGGGGTRQNLKSVVMVLFVEVRLSGMTEGSGGGGGGIWIWMIYSFIYSFRPLAFKKGYSWMTYHLTVHTAIVPISKKNGEGWAEQKDDRI